MPLKLVLVLGLVMLLVAQPLMASSTALAMGSDMDFGNLPLSFVPNVGQTDAGVHFQAHDMGGTIFFSSGEVVLALPSTVARLRFEGANPEPNVIGTDRLSGTVSYFIGDDPAKWRAGIRTYGGILYEGLYPGIDLAYDGKSGQLKSTYLVDPGADPSAIGWRYEGATGVQVDQATGDLLIDLSGSTLIERAPVAWQEVRGERIPVAASYVLADDGGIGLELGSYDPSLPLVIDPTITYSTFLGGNGFDVARGIAVDSDGNILVAGTSQSSDFPANPVLGYSGAKDVFVVKINAAGDAMIYGTYLGGEGKEDGNSIALDAGGNAYVTGETDSPDFPTTPGVLQGALDGGGDAFVTKLAPDGGLVYSTYMGGEMGEEGEDIAVDSDGNAYVVGTTFSTDWPTGSPIQPQHGGLFDAFVVKLNPSGSALIYGTYLGGSNAEGGVGIALDAQNRACILGVTLSDDLPTRNPLQANNAGIHDLFMAKLNAAGDDLLYSTYLGGSDNDYGYGIAIDGDGNTYYTGMVESADFPVTPDAFDTTCGNDGSCNVKNISLEPLSDAFAVKLSASGDELLYSTYLGGSDLDKGYAIAVDGDGNAHITGDTFSPDFPYRRLRYELPLTTDAFIVKLEADGDYDYGFHFGGKSGDYGQGIALDGEDIYITGITFSEDFPTTANALQPAHAGGDADAFVIKLEPLPIGGVTLPLDPARVLGPWVGLAVAFGLALLGGSALLMRKRVS